MKVFILSFTGLSLFAGLFVGALENVGTRFGIILLAILILYITILVSYALMKILETK